MDILKLFHKDLSTFSKKDLITLARYYNISLDDNLIKSIAEKQYNLYNKAKMLSDADAKGIELARAAYKDDLQKVKELIQAGANVNVKSKKFWIPLMNAKKENIAEELIKAGADLNIQDNNGWTPLMNADVNISILLIQAGANVNIQDNDGFTALMKASVDRHPRKVKELIQAGANVNIQNKHGDTALILVCAIWEKLVNEYDWMKYDDNPDIISIIKDLLDAGANRDITNNNGRKAIDYTRENSTYYSLLLNYKRPIDELFIKYNTRSDIMTARRNKIITTEQMNRLLEMINTNTNTNQNIVEYIQPLPNNFHECSNSIDLITHESWKDLYNQNEVIDPIMLNVYDSNNNIIRKECAERANILYDINNNQLIRQTVINNMQIFPIKGEITYYVTVNTLNNLSNVNMNYSLLPIGEYEYTFVGGRIVQGKTIVYNVN